MACVVGEASVHRPNDQPLTRPAAAVGRDDSSASGIFRGANLRRQLSGGESEGLAGSSRPIAEVRWLEERSSTADGTSLDNVYVN